mgnify:CR=1 FL=1
MKLYEILDVNVFMNELLAKNGFDEFFAGAVTLRTMTDFFIEGKRNKEWFDEEMEPYVRWKEIKAYLYELIKGKKKPHLFKLELLVDEKGYLEMAPEQEMNGKSPLYYRMNFRYENEQLFLTTAVSHASFELDKTAELLWDSFAAAYLKRLSISVREA